MNRADQAIADTVRAKLRSWNPIPCERCVIRAAEIAAIDRRLIAHRIPQRALALQARLRAKVQL